MLRFFSRVVHSSSLSPPLETQPRRDSSDNAIADILAKFDPVQDEMDAWIETLTESCECSEALYLQAQVIFHRRASRDYERCFAMMLNTAAANIEMGFYHEAET